MPNSLVYEAAAHDLRGVVRQLGDKRPRLDSADWDDAARHGYVRTLIERSLNASRSNLDSALDSIVTLANECSWRQSVCDQYDNDLRDYKLRREAYDKSPLDTRGTPPTVPPPPYPWVEPTVQV